MGYNKTTGGSTCVRQYTVREYTFKKGNNCGTGGCTFFDIKNERSASIHSTSELGCEFADAVCPENVYKFEVKSQTTGGVFKDWTDMSDLEKFFLTDEICDQPEKIIDGRCDGECTEIAIKTILIEYECYDNNREALEAVEGANQPINDIQLSTANDAWSGAFDDDEDEILKDLYSTYMLCLCKLLKNEQILDEEKPQAVAELFERIMYCMAMALDSERGRRVWSGIIRGVAGGAAAFFGIGVGFIFALGGPVTLLLGAVLGGITIASFNGLNGVEWKNELMRCLKANLCE